MYIYIYIHISIYSSNTFNCCEVTLRPFAAAPGAAPPSRKAKGKAVGSLGALRCPLQSLKQGHTLIRVDYWGYIGIMEKKMETTILYKALSRAIHI